MAARPLGVAAGALVLSADAVLWLVGAKINFGRLAPGANVAATAPFGSDAESFGAPDDEVAPKLSVPNSILMEQRPMVNENWRLKTSTSGGTLMTVQQWEIALLG